MKFKKIVYVGLAVDLIHEGHINILRIASRYGDVIVGLLTDEAIASYKNTPYLNYDRRKIIVQNIKYVKRVIPQKTLSYVPNLNLVKPNFVVHGDDWKKGVQKRTRLDVIKTLKKWSGTLIEPKYTKNISTTLIKNRILEIGVSPQNKVKSNQKKLVVDFIKLNHWLNARKITHKYLSINQKTLSRKLKFKKNFKITPQELKFLNFNLSISSDKIELQDKIPDYIYWTKSKINKSKRPINRDGIHFYNYYSLPIPKGFVGPVILDILCPKNKLPKLNNGHLEQAITVNLGNSDIYGRWGKTKNKVNFSKIKFNNTKQNSWIIGDTYLEPTYCPHSYSRATNHNSQILSYTAKSPLEKFIKNLNNWSESNYKNLINKVRSRNLRTTILKFYLDNKGVDLKYLSKSIGIKVKNLDHVIKKKKILIKTCKFLKIDTKLFSEKKYVSEDKIGKTYLSFKESFKTIRKFKSYTIASMASSERYTDLFGYFIKVSKNKKIKDLCDYASSHYLVTKGNFCFNVGNKTIKIKKGDAIWMSSFKSHGFSGSGSLLKISNGENLDTSDISEILNIYKPTETLNRSYKDKISWGYD